MKLPRLSWAKIEEEFNARFSKIFMARNAKAHFDFLTEIVDGAKERWRSLQLLDAVLCAVYCCRPLDYRSVRRNFEHHDAFQEAVMKAMEIAIEESLSQEKGENESVTNEGLEEKEAANIPAQADDEKEADDLDIARATTIVETTNENEIGQARLHLVGMAVNAQCKQYGNKLEKGAKWSVLIDDCSWH